MSALVGACLTAGRTNSESLCRVLMRHYGHDSATPALADGDSFAADIARLAGPRSARPVGAATCGSLMVVADSHIHNRTELASDLGIDPGRAGDYQDADFILACWHRWGADCVVRLVGDFAFALWNAERRQLFLARDFLGQRALHYRPLDGGAAFASSPAVLASLSGAVLCEVAWARYLALLPQSGSESMYEGVLRVLPGQLVTFDGRVIHEQRYWKPPTDRLDMSHNDAIDEARRLIDLAVAERLPTGSAPVAAQLSAGMDSSAVATSAALQSSGRVVALTAVPRGAGELIAGPYHVGEGPIAAQTAALYPNMEHQLCVAEARALSDQSADWNALLEQPVRSIENMGWIAESYRLAAKAGADRLLVGIYGNLSFSYAGLPLLAELLGQGRASAWFDAARQFKRHSGARWRGVLLFSLGGRLPALGWRCVRRVRGMPRFDPLGDVFLRPDHPVAAQLRGESMREPALVVQPSNDSLAERFAGLDWVDNGLFNFGMRQRFGVETSDPTADRRLVELSLRLSTDHFLHGGITRSVARGVLRGRVPDEVINGRTRGYQGADWRLFAEMDLPGLLAEIDRIAAVPQLAAMIDLPRLRTLVVDWPSSGWNDYNQVRRYRCDVIRTIHMCQFARTRFA